MSETAAGAGAPDPDIFTANGGQAAADRAATVIAMREEAQAAHEASLASAAGTRAHAQSLLESADAIETQAEADLAAAMNAASDLERGV